MTTTTTGGAAGDVAVPASTVTYDPGTGAATSVSAGGKTITTVFDTLGRPVSYTDADGVTSTTSYDIAGRVVATYDGKATTALSYDGASEHRGVVTAVDTGLAGIPSTFSTTYDARGVATTTAPGGVVKTVGVDAAGFTTSTGYKTAAGVSIGSWTQTADVAGRVATQAAPIVAGTRNRAFTYDGAARLTGVKEQATGQCTARGYGFDKNSNRTSRTTYTPVPGACPATPGASLTTTTRVFDTADRLTTSSTTTTAVGGMSGSGSYSYDGFGRATTVPSVDAGGTAMTQTFFTDDKIATQTQAGTTRSWTRDPAGRQNSWADTTAGVTGARRINHYDGASDSPSWTDEGNGTATRAVTGPDGGLAIIATHTATGVSARLQIGDPQGTIITTIAVKTNAGLADLGAQTDVDEYGQTTTGATPRYGWHGTDQRSTDGLGTTMLMGVRMYQPATGRFLTTDPVYGGNDNTYTHPVDPVNKEDLTGEFALDPSVAFQCGQAGIGRKQARCLALAWRVRDYANSAGRNDNDIEVMRHVMWSTMLVWSVGYSAAKRVLAAHEQDPADYPDSLRDKANNRIGLAWGKKTRSRAAQYQGLWNPGKVALAKAVYDRARIRGRVTCVFGRSTVNYCTADQGRWR